MIAYFALVFVALTLALPFGKQVWGPSWPAPRLGLELTGGEKLVVRAKGGDRLSPEQRELLQGILRRRLQGP